MGDRALSWISPLKQIPRDLWVAWGATVVAFFPIFSSWAADWRLDPNYSQGFLIPLISIFLAARALRQSPHATDETQTHRWVGPAIVLLGLTGYVLGTGGSELFTVRSGFVLTWLGSAWWIAGSSIGRLLAVPTLFLLFSIPIPSVLYYNVAVPLQTIAAVTATSVLQIGGVPVVRDGNMLLLPGTTLEVADACSGIRSLTVLVALGALWAYLEKGSVLRRLALFGCAVPLAVLGNAVRVSLTCLGVYLAGNWVAEGAAHDAMGLVVFLVTLGGLHLIARAWKSG